MDQSTRTLYVCVLLFMLLGASSYKTLTEDQMCTGRMSSLYLERSSGESTLIQLGPSRDQQICNISVELPAHTQVMLAVRVVPRDQLSLYRYVNYSTCNLELKSNNKIQGKLALCENTSLSQVLLIYNFQDPIIVYLRLPAGGNRDSLRASGILFNFVTRGTEACSKPGMVQCQNKMASTQQCVQPQLACDGLVNCPEDDSDENNDQCHRDELPDVSVGKEQQMPYSSRKEFQEREEFKVVGMTLLMFVVCILLMCVLACCGYNKCCTCPDPPMSPHPAISTGPLVPMPTAIYIVRDGEVPSGSTLQRPTAVYVLEGNKAHVEATASTSSNAATTPLISTQPMSRNLSVPQPMPSIHPQPDNYPMSPTKFETPIFPITPTAPPPSTHGVNHTYLNPLPHIGFCASSVPHISPTLPTLRTLPTLPPHDTYSMPSTNNEEELPPGYYSLFPDAEDKDLQGHTSSSPC